ncbi:hypothetical protein [Methylocystis sp. JR02]|nr:hypothetical protein [Methylocystis sp. JR02]MDJ0449541.1 hypothetical protein [Methylocystis sp. JR02]
MAVPCFQTLFGVRPVWPNDARVITPGVVVPIARMQRGDLRQGGSFIL